MSHLQRNFMRSRMTGALPPLAARTRYFRFAGFIAFYIISLRIVCCLWSLLLNSETCYNRMAPAKKGRHKDYSPDLWDKYFIEKKDVRVDEKHVFRVYLTQEPKVKGPVLVLLHGGGYSALTWAQFSVSDIF